MSTRLGEIVLYRVNSLCGTRFRIGATNVLRQHRVQGYTVHARR